VVHGVLLFGFSRNQTLNFKFNWAEGNNKFARNLKLTEHLQPDSNEEAKTNIVLLSLKLHPLHPV
jgi:hypothetical protein